MGLLRLLTNHQVMGKDALAAEGAWRVLDRIAKESNIFFASEPPGLDHIWKTLTTSKQAGANFWTDAYLAAFAWTSGYTLVTFDRSFAKYRNAPVRVLGADS